MRRRRQKPNWFLTALLFFSCLGLAISMVLTSYRQSRTAELLRAHDQIERDVDSFESERDELRRKIQYLEGRSRISQVAEESLGMHKPEASEMVILSLESLP
ncbi:MAG: cell division protein FtsL [Gemmatimonadetes bacterium]|nr:cell division protein FtsL [Gemmatimonadota bacterium]